MTSLHGIATFAVWDLIYSVPSEPSITVMPARSAMASQVFRVATAIGAVRRISVAMALLVAGSHNRTARSVPQRPSQSFTHARDVTAVFLTLITTRGRGTVPFRARNRLTRLLPARLLSALMA